MLLLIWIKLFIYLQHISHRQMSFSQIYLTMLIITNHLQCLLAHLIDHGFRRLARFFYQLCYLFISSDSQYSIYT